MTVDRSSIDLTMEEKARKGPVGVQCRHVFIWSGCRSCETRLDPVEITPVAAQPGQAVITLNSRVFIVDRSTGALRRSCSSVRFRTVQGPGSDAGLTGSREPRRPYPSGNSGATGVELEITEEKENWTLCRGSIRKEGLT
jgi:hypothetical protein